MGRHLPPGSLRRHLNVWRLREPVGDITRDDAAVRKLLAGKPRIAVVGASDNPARDSNRIFLYLKRHGYEVLPVNPVLKELDGIPAVPDLAAAKAKWGTVDIVDVFRNAEAALGVAEEAAKVGAKAIWFQLGVVNPDAIRVSVDAGMQTVVDRCIKIEHARLLS
jgi:uncharacterized protein